MIHIKPCSFSDIAPYIATARRERLGFTPNTNYYAARLGEEIAGFCGIAFKSNYAVLKNVWVKPEHRRKGIGEALIVFQIKTAREANCHFAKAFCTDMSIKLYLKHGAVITKSFKKSTQVEIRFS